MVPIAMLGCLVRKRTCLIGWRLGDHWLILGDISQGYSLIMEKQTSLGQWTEFVWVLVFSPAEWQASFLSSPCIPLSRGCFKCTYSSLTLFLTCDWLLWLCPQPCSQRHKHHWQHWAQEAVACLILTAACLDWSCPDTQDIF